MDKEDSEKERSEVHHIWIGERERIASFHKVEAYELQIIKGHDAYVNYLQLLQEKGFRFQ